ncbi:DUF3592 domain-containing protein [Ruminococcus sp.]|uniref:DUF3592 domain-containing protein n=1 Tax=Ruminococcus sp. TaxID=41978 RepID=UPI0025E710E3|nr:DUF3592 domain-containing protein [Ruminococcus sp.]
MEFPIILLIIGILSCWLFIPSLFILFGILYIRTRKKARERCTDFVEATVVNVQDLSYRSRNTRRHMYVALLEFYYGGINYERQYESYVFASAGDHVQLAINPDNPEDFRLVEEIDGSDKAGIIMICIGAFSSLCILAKAIAIYKSHSN